MEGKTLLTLVMCLGWLGDPFDESDMSPRKP